MPDLTPGKRLIARCLISYLGNRTVSAQETCALLLNDCLWHCSRDIATIPLGNSRMVTCRGENPGIIDKYCRRGPTMEDVCLYDYCSLYDIRKKPTPRGTIPRRTKSAAVMYFPRPRWNPASQSAMEQYYDYQLRLYKPFRSFADLKGNHNTFEEAFLAANLPTPWLTDQQVDLNNPNDHVVDIPQMDDSKLFLLYVHLSTT